MAKVFLDIRFHALSTKTTLALKTAFFLGISRDCLEGTPSIVKFRAEGPDDTVYD